MISRRDVKSSVGRTKTLMLLKGDKFKSTTSTMFDVVHCKDSFHWTASIGLESRSRSTVFLLLNSSLGLVR